MLDECFQHPPWSYRIVPFWFWNGDMNEAAIRLQIAEMADKGVGGFFICARQGLTVPYLSQAWFERVRLAVETAKTCGLEVWIYDEYPYPSGMAGGEVTLQHPDAKHHTLWSCRQTWDGEQQVSLELPWAKVLLAAAVPYDTARQVWRWDQSIDISQHIGSLQNEHIFQQSGLTAYNPSRYFTAHPQKYLQCTLPSGKWELAIAMQVEVQDFKYYGHYMDPCHSEAVRTFMQLTHERYRQEMGSYFGDVVKGVFSDEVGLLGNFPWSAALPHFFAETQGCDLLQRDSMLALLHGASEKTAQIRYDYFQSLHLLLRESYHAQLSRWAQQNKLSYVTEVNSIRATTQRLSDIPGGDSGHEKLGRSLAWILAKNAFSFRYNPKMISSIARQTGKQRALIECFHSVGWSMTLQDAKWMLDRFAAMGINMFNFHAFFYSIDGLRKHDAPPSQFLQNPYWKHFRQLADYAARLCYLMSEGAAAISLAVLDPTTTLWTHLGNPIHEFDYMGDDDNEKARLEALKADWAAICRELLTHQIDFDHLDPELLMEATIESGTLRIGHAAYSILVIPPIANLEQGAWRKLQAFLANGGIVITLGLLPYQQIEADIDMGMEMRKCFGLERAPQHDYWSSQSIPGTAKWITTGGGGYFLSCQGNLVAADGIQSLLEQLELLLPPRVRLSCATGDTASFLMQHRIMQDNSHLIFIAHQESGERHVVLHSSLPIHSHAVERLHLETGEVMPLQMLQHADGWQIPLTFAAYESCCLRFRQASTGGPSEKAHAPAEEAWTLSVDAATAWEIQAQQKNVLRFGSFGFAPDPDDKGREQGWTTGEAAQNWPQVEVKTVIDQCAELADRKQLPLAFRQAFGTPVKLTVQYPLVCWYHTAFAINTLSGELSLLMEPGGIAGPFTLYVNGHPLTRGDFQSEAYNNQAYLSCRVDHLLRQGRNELVIRVEAANDWDGIVSPLYMTGRFGVYFSADGEAVIDALPESASLHSGPLEGFPYYAGTWRLKKQVSLDELPGDEAGTFEVKFQGWDERLHDCVEVEVNGCPLGVRCWSPYRWFGKREHLRVGANEIVVRLTNTLAGMLDGTYFDDGSHTLKNVRDSF